MNVFLDKWGLEFFMKDESIIIKMIDKMNYNLGYRFDVNGKVIVYGPLEDRIKLVEKIMVELEKGSI